LILSLLVLGAFCSLRVLKEETYAKVKSSANWESYDIHENPFKNYSEEQVKSLLGTTLMWDQHNLPFLQDTDDHSNANKLPAEFDSRKQWPECVQPVRQQEHCGSCWAFSASSVLQDRFCIASKAAIKVVLSPQDMVSCDTGDMGCQGGLLDRAWSYLEKSGIVADTCLPYVSGDGKTVPHCPHGTCSDSKLKFTKYRANAGSSKPLTCANQIKEEIFNHGPVQTGFMVYEDFMHYKSGIYEFTHGNQLGGHAVKIVGWGNENGKEFWIAQNSWGPEWGENGFFRIKFGECLFDQNAYVGQANVQDFTPNNLFWI
jgi:cathepsin B